MANRRGDYVMLCGIALLGVITASVAAWFVKANDEEGPDLAGEVAALRAEIAALRHDLAPR